MNDSPRKSPDVASMRLVVFALTGIINLFLILLVPSLVAADPLSKTIAWGESHKYDKGHLPMIAVEGLDVVEVHQALEKKDLIASMASGVDVMKAPRLFYHVGRVDLGTKTISWGESHKYDQGRWPSVALEAQLVTVVHQAKGGEFLWYRVGNLDPATKTIKWGGQYSIR